MNNLYLFNTTSKSKEYILTSHDIFVHKDKIVDGENLYFCNMIQYSNENNKNVEKRAKANWLEEYKVIVSQLLDLDKSSNSQEYYNNVVNVLEQHSLTEISSAIKNNTEHFEVVDTSMVYSISNLLSKYMEINSKSKDSNLYYSLTDDNNISLTIIKKNRCSFKNDEYNSKLNLVFYSTGKVGFSSSDNDDEYFVQGVYDSPKSFLKNAKIKRILGFVDEY